MPVAAESGSESRRTLWVFAASMVAAILASACCILPLVFGGLGLSAIALAGLFEQARPYLLVLTAAIVAAGFYFSYFRAAPDGATACAAPRPRIARMSRPLLWVATLAVTGLALFPSYAGIFAGPAPEPHPSLGKVPSETIVLRVDGMTCEGCAIEVQRKLAEVPGVLRAEVSFDEARASVQVDLASPPPNEQLLQAVERAGYRGSLGSPP